MKQQRFTAVDEPRDRPRFITPEQLAYTHVAPLQVGPRSLSDRFDVPYPISMTGEEDTSRPATRTRRQGPRFSFSLRPQQPPSPTPVEGAPVIAYHPRQPN
eukprot:Sspe_Gene.78581::Locus_49161_Transcript_1_2_Confidence_0.667_Length_460::g.78581::m.78581